jgi:hypothetical protein
MQAKCFTFRYFPLDAKVYMIKKSLVVPTTGNGLFNSMVLSEPYVGSDKDMRNAIVAYPCKRICDMKLVEASKLSFPDWKVECVETSVIDLQGFCDSLSMPMMVVLSESSDLATRDLCKEVYYYEGRLKDDDTNKAWLRLKNKK